MFSLDFFCVCKSSCAVACQKNLSMACFYSMNGLDICVPVPLAGDTLFFQISLSMFSKDEQFFKQRFDLSYM